MIKSYPNFKSHPKAQKWNTELQYSASEHPLNSLNWTLRTPWMPALIAIDHVRASRLSGDALSTVSTSTTSPKLRWQKLIRWFVRLWIYRRPGAGFQVRIAVEGLSTKAQRGRHLIFNNCLLLIIDQLCRPDKIRSGVQINSPMPCHHLDRSRRPKKIE